MTETQKDYQRIESERFEMIRFGCPWRNTPRIAGEVYCLATTEVCRLDGCAVWHIVKAVTE